MVACGGICACSGRWVLVEVFVPAVVGVWVFVPAVVGVGVWVFVGVFVPAVV